MTRDRTDKLAIVMPHYLGLCSTCVHAATCTYRIYGGQPVWHCNEFDDTEEADPSERPSYQRSPQGAPLQPSETLAAQTGLCANCEERSLCRLPKPAGGVWQCEEYR
jgi:hypothetical protein